MAAVTFDTLKFARRLKEVGVPEAQAEVMAEAFVHNMDALVTKDYLDECLDARFAAQDLRLEQRFAIIEVQFSDLRGELKLQRWILAAIAASTVIPTMVKLMSL